MRNWLIFILTFITTFQVVAGVFNWPCVEILGTSTPVVQHMSPESDLELTPEIIERIRKHSLFQLSQNIRNTHPDLNFVFLFTFKEDWVVQDINKGEGQQALLIKKYLEFLFPQAQIRSSNSTDLSPNSIGISIRDTAEFGNGSHSPSSDAYKMQLDMLTLKPGNPGLRRNHQSTSTKQKRKVVHLYLRMHRYLKSPVIIKLVEDVQKSINPDVLIISTSSTASPLSVINPQHHLKSHPLYDPVAIIPLAHPHETADKNSSIFDQHNFDASFLLSELTFQDLEKPGSKIIFNDTMGLLPAIYEDANLAIVVGPVNFFQPLNMGVPTLLITNEDTNKDYKTDGLNNMIATAKLSGGFVHTSHFNDLPELLDRVQQLPQPQIPAFAPDENGQDAFTRVLDRIEEMIRTQLNIAPSEEATKK